jgi:hypothetical protein
MQRLKFLWVWINPVFKWVEGVWIVLGILAQLRDEFLPRWAGVHVYSILPQLSFQSWIIVGLVILLIAVVEAAYTQTLVISDAKRRKVITVDLAPTKEPSRGCLRKYVLPIGIALVLALIYQLWPQDITVAIMLPPLGGKVSSGPTSTVRDLYDNDFRLLIRAFSKHLVILKDGTRWNLESKLLLDYPHKLMSVAFFVPGSSRANDISEWIAGAYATAIGDVLANVNPRIWTPGKDDGTNLTDLRSSGRVYLYHEDEFSAERKAYLSELFRRNNAMVLYRGFLDVLGGSIEEVDKP